MDARCCPGCCNEAAVSESLGCLGAHVPVRRPSKHHTLRGEGSYTIMQQGGGCWGQAGAVLESSAASSHPSSTLPFSLPFPSSSCFLSNSLLYSSPSCWTGEKEQIQMRTDMLSNLSPYQRQLNLHAPPAVTLLGLHLGVE